MVTRSLVVCARWPLSHIVAVAVYNRQDQLPGAKSWLGAFSVHVSTQAGHESVTTDEVSAGRLLSPQSSSWSHRTDYTLLSSANRNHVDGREPFAHVELALVPALTTLH